MYIKNGRIVTENDIFKGFVYLKDGYIDKVGKGEPSEKTAKDIDAGGNLVTPGFIDIHCHGGDGVRFEDNPEKAYNAHLSRGTTGILPTIGYNIPLVKFISAVESIAKMTEPGILGINCEGPYINPEYGADTRLARSIDISEAKEIYKAGQGRIRVWTFSPDIAGAEELKTFIGSKPEVIAGAGHTECDEKALEGIRLICHLFDAMGPKERKVRAIHENGTAEIVLVSDNLFAELIADSRGVHVPAELLKIAYRCLGNRCILISDAVSTEENASDVNYNERGELAGSLLSVSKAVVNMKKHTGISWPEAVRLGSLNPAALLGIQGETGSIERGKKADIVIMDEQAHVKAVFREGRRY